MTFFRQTAYNSVHEQMEVDAMQIVVVKCPKALSWLLRAVFKVK